MRKRLFVVLIMVANAVGATEPVAFRADARVEIDAAGKPTKIEASRELPESIRNFIERTVKTWHFTPPSRDGIGGAGVTYLALGACAVPEGNGYRMAVDYKGNGPRLAETPKFPTPRYPSEAARAGREADLVAHWIVETDGRATLERVESNHGPTPRKNDPFYKAIAEWLAQLRYEPEEFAGHPVRTRMTVPVPFTISPHRSNPTADRQERMDQICQSSECQLAASKLHQGAQPIAMDSPFNVKSR